MNKVVYKHGSFINYKGDKIEFTLAAVSIPTCDVLASGSLVQKVLSIGAAFKNPQDVEDREIGEAIAYGKAIKRTDHLIASTDCGLINTKMVEALLEQEAAYLQVNPGRYIAGYNEAKQKWEAKVAEQEYLNSLTDAERLAIDTVARTKDYDKFLEAVEARRKNIGCDSSPVSTELHQA